MIVTSGYRSMEDQKRIYAKKGISNYPKRSKHLYCQACDFYDPDGHLKHFIVNNLRLMEEIGLWFEDFFYTENWVHVQIVPPNSGKRFFIP